MAISTPIPPANGLVNDICNGRSDIAGRCPRQLARSATGGAGCGGTTGDRLPDRARPHCTECLKFVCQRWVEKAIRAVTGAPRSHLSGEDGADERTRTFTGVTPQRPQRCASTNSATSARSGLDGGCLAKCSMEGKGVFARFVGPALPPRGLSIRPCRPSTPRRA